MDGYEVGVCLTPLLLMKSGLIRPCLLLLLQILVSHINRTSRDYRGEYHLVIATVAGPLIYERGTIFMLRRHYKTKSPVTATVDSDATNFCS
jgi:hypothetical protein